MARLTWGDRGARLYENGVDQGVLFVGSNPGVAWSGLISVTESPSGGEAKPFYLDGVKYLNFSSAEEFAATLSAFYAPPEFALCDGNLAVAPGLYAKHQRRRSFGLAYRSGIGNDVSADQYGYELHVIYNALAAPSSRNRKTKSNQVEADPFEWELTSVPPAGLFTHKATSHFTINSTEADAGSLAALEGFLYGTVSDEPKLPTVQELIAIFA